MSDDASTYDPRNLIREAYRIDGIGPEDCRSIFLDWALGLKDGQDSVAGATALLAHYADRGAEHPMSQVLRAAIQGNATAKRRGGASGRRR